MQLTIRIGRRYRVARPNEIMDAAAALLVDEQIGKLTYLEQRQRLHELPGDRAVSLARLGDARRVSSQSAPSLR